MLKIEQSGENSIKVSASGSLEDMHTELALLICALSEKFCSASGMSFDRFLILTLLLAKKTREDISMIDMSDFNKFVEDLDLNS